MFFLFYKQFINNFLHKLIIWKLTKLYMVIVLKVLKTFPDECIDLVFADPPYNLQLKNELS